MKKGIILAALLSFAGAVSAADLSTVGSTSTQVNTDYSYTRVFNTGSFVSQHTAEIGGQLNLGSVGSFTAEIGKARVYAFGGKADATTYSASYSNALPVGPLSLVGTVGYTNAAVDGSSVNADAFDLSAAVLFPVVTNVKGYAQYTSVPEHNAETVGAGIVVAVNNKLNAKVGYEHALDVSNNVRGIVASISYKF